MYTSCMFICYSYVCICSYCSTCLHLYCSVHGSGGDMTIKYIYFNHMNLATKTTVHVDTRKTRLVSVPVDILSTVADMNSDLKQ